MGASAAHVPGPRSLGCSRGLARNQNEKGGPLQPGFHQECSLGSLSPSMVPQGQSCTCWRFHMPARERRIFRFPTARWRPAAAPPNPTLDTGPCRAAQIWTPGPKQRQLEHLREQRLPQLCQDLLQPKTRPRLLGHQPTLLSGCHGLVSRGLRLRQRWCQEGSSREPLPAARLWAKGRLGSGQGSCSLPLD